MKRRTIVALGLVAVLASAITAATSGATKRATANSITVWLQVDAQSGWADVVAAATQKFQADHPGTTVNVQYQNWGDHLQTFGVPYYAGSRVVTYRKDLFSKAGIKKLPATTAQYVADAKKLLAKNSSKGFSPVYIAGTDWYVAMAFVFDYGGGIATQVSGKWHSLLSSPKSLAGLAAYKAFFDATSRGSKTTDETHPNPYDVYAQGQAASILGPSWFTCCVGAKYKASTAQFVMPGHAAGQSMPGFAGGSDLAVPVTTGSKSLASDWIKDFTSTASEKALQAKDNIPNATKLLSD